MSPPEDLACRRPPSLEYAKPAAIAESPGLNNAAKANVIQQVLSSCGMRRATLVGLRSASTADARGLCCAALLRPGYSWFAKGLAPSREGGRPHTRSLGGERRNNIHLPMQVDTMAMMQKNTCASFRRAHAICQLETLFDDVYWQDVWA